MSGVLATVSLITVISNPEKFHNAKIIVGGFLTAEFESEAIFVNRDDYTYGLAKNGIALNLRRGSNVDLQPEDKKYTLIQGVFRVDHLGPSRRYSGSLDVIAVFPNWEKLQKMIHQ